MLRYRRVLVGVVAVCLGTGVAVARPDEARGAKAREMTARSSAYLQAQQDKATGGWSLPREVGPGEVPPPHLPAITGLVVLALLSDPAVKPESGVISRAVGYMLSFQQADGGIYDRVLPSYNTSVVLSALAKVGTPEARRAVPGAQRFLRDIQWSEESRGSAGGGEAARPVERNHPFYGGVGYGQHGRPDNSNLTMMLQAMHDSGVSPDDESFQRALTFLRRTQMLEGVNDMPYAAKSRQGGFIYATVPDAQSVEGRAGQSFAGTMEETLDDGTKVSRLRAYGSMTYAGFKSYVYADLPRDDERVRAALGWIRRHYTLEENPGVGTDGLYYYYLTMARALAAWGEPTITAAPPGAAPAERSWADDLIDKLAELQQPDGSYKVVDDRWMENNPVLVTAYATIALGEALKMPPPTPSSAR